MDFGFTEEQEKLRKEVKEFLLDELPSNHKRGVFPLTDELADAFTRLEQKAAERGWLAAPWPKEFGGLELSEIERGIVIEEMLGYWSLRLPGFGGISLMGPALFLFGTEEQKKKYLPEIARAKTVWMQAATEPNAGSETANVQTRAVQDGDYFVINGQKTFISGQPNKPDYLYTLARTADTKPKHRGLSIFLVAADTPGITYRPFNVIDDRVCMEIFFDNVRVHKDCLLGKLNRGFYQQMTTFEFERGAAAVATGLLHDLEEFVQFCKETKRNGKPLMEDPEVRDTLAQMRIEIEAQRLCYWRTVSRFEHREKLGGLDFELAGFVERFISPSLYEKMMNIIGLYGQLMEESKWVPLVGSIEHNWRRTRSLHRGGTTEVSKMVLANRGLNMPRREA